jgi:hypothetical protein
LLVLEDWKVFQSSVEVIILDIAVNSAVRVD